MATNKSKSITLATKRSPTNVEGFKVVFEMLSAFERGLTKTTRKKTTRGKEI